MHKPSLEVALELDRLLGFPTASFSTIHIAGSNGKGSVTTKIAKALELSGYKVGVYTSSPILPLFPRADRNRRRTHLRGGCCTRNEPTFCTATQSHLF